MKNMGKSGLTRSIYDQIIDAESQDEKLEILKKYNKESLFRRIVFFAYNPMIQFDMNDFETTKTGIPNGLGISKFMHIFDDIIKSNLTKQESNFACQIAMAHINDTEAEIFKGILTKTLDLGLEHDTINKAYGGMIPGYPLQQVAIFDKDTVKKFTYPCVVQKMSSGMRTNIVVKGNIVQFRNKQGEIFHEFDRFSPQFSALAQNGNIVFDGHAVVIDEKNNPIPDLTDEEILSYDIDYVRFILWDSIRFDGFVEGSDSRIGYNWRFNGLEHMMFLAVDQVSDPVYGLPEQQIVENLQQAIDISEKFGDVVLKDFSGTWRTGVNNHEVAISKSKLD
jgi:hypothetical protein